MSKTWNKIPKYSGVVCLFKGKIFLEKDDSMRIVRQNEGVHYTPAGHDNSVISRKLFNPHNGSRVIDVHVTTFSSNSGMEEEAHESSEHVFYMLDGKLEIRQNGNIMTILEAGDAVHIPAGELHQLHNSGPDTGVFLAVTTLLDTCT